MEIPVNPLPLLFTQALASVVVQGHVIPQSGVRAHLYKNTHLRTLKVTVTLLKSRQFSEVLTREGRESATLLFPMVPKAVPKNGSDTES